MNIAVFLDSGTLSGAEKRSAKVARAMIARGHDVTLFMGPGTHAALAGSDYRFDWPPIVVWSTPRWLGWLGRGRRRLAPLRRALRLDAVERRARRGWWRRLMRRHGVELAHVYLNWPLCRDLPVPHLFEITSPEMARLLIGGRYAFPRETLLHPNSESVDAALGDYAPGNRRIVAPHAFFDPAEPEGFTPPPKENLVVFGHRMVERKNPLIFARAAKRFLAARPDWRVAIRGVGPMAEAVRDAVADEIASGRVLFGFQANLMDELHRARVFVSIESEDNYSNQSVLEAMWCRNALVLSDRGRTRARYFADNGVLCEPEEDSVLAALLAVTAEPAALARYGENGRRHVEAAFSREAYLDHLEAVYREARTQWAARG